MSKELPKELKRLCESQALGQVLTEWDDAMSYEEILDSLDADETYPTNESIVVWEVYENYYANYIANEIRNLYLSFERVAQSALEMGN